jgi:flagellar motility protein MotE (MotC chaperone)
MLERLRVLPVLIVAATLLFGLKLDNVWRDAGAIDVAAALAKEGGPAPEAKPTPEAKPIPEAKSAPSKPAEGKQAAEAKPAEAPAPVKATSFSPAEVEILQNLAERRQQLDGRAREIEAQGALLDAAERRVQEKIAELKKLEATIGGLIRQHDEQGEAQLKSLVKVYENMKPKDAARIFEELEMAVLLGVVERMREAKIAPILASMDPGKAKAITVELATGRKLPTSGG